VIGAALFRSFTNAAVKIPLSPATLVRIRAGAAAVLGVSFLRLAFTNSNSYLYWPHQDTPMASWGMDITRYGPSAWRILIGAIVALLIMILVRLAAAAAERRKWQIAAAVPRYLFWVAGTLFRIQSLQCLPWPALSAPPRWMAIC
jgi:hypothetical protein